MLSRRHTGCFHTLACVEADRETISAESAVKAHTMGEENSETAVQQPAAAPEEEKAGNTYVIRPNFQHK